MSTISVGINMEFIRCEDKPFEAGVERARALGFDWVEPMVHNGRELLSEAGYFHSWSMDNEPLELKDILARHQVRPSGLSAHTPLMRPEISVPYLEKAIRLAAAIGAPVVNTDEGIRPDWLEDEECFQVMRYTLKKVLQIAERYGVMVAIEPHQSITKKTEGLLRVASLVKSPMLKINYDTGNAFLGGEDPYDGLVASLPLSGPPTCQGHLHLPGRGGAGQGHRDSGRLRLRGGCDRLGPGHRHPPESRLERRPFG